MRNLRGSLRGQLALLADVEEQRHYERALPRANVPAELLCGWFDDCYLPDSAAFQQSFNPDERQALDAFHALFEAASAQLPRSWKLDELHAHPAWAQVVAAAAATLSAIPEEASDRSGRG